MKVFSIELYDSDGLYKVIYVAANDRNEAVDVMKASYNETRYDVMCLEGAIFRTDKPCEIKTRFCIEDGKVVLSEDERIRGAIIDHLKDNDLIEWAAWLEKQGEQKPADKVEPKFKVGDWVVFKNKHQSIYQVEKIENGYYILRHTHGGTFRVCVLHDESLRLWTIQDAKDGDMLAFYSEYRGNKMVQVGIIEKYVGKHGGCSNTFKIYVGVNWDNNLQIGEYMGCSDIRPATKEHRDTLMKAMSDAGYTFDFEKKELKNIHVIDEGKSEMDYCFTKMMNGEKVSSAWSREDEQNLNAALSYINDDSLCRWLKDVIHVKYDKYAWSEEDETKIKSIIALLKSPALCTMDGNKDIIDENIKYLKSIKERVQSQPKQEWSEDDKGNLLTVKCIVDEVWHNQDFREDIGYSPEELNSLWNWLDIIWQRVEYPQNTWKPSDEQMQALDEALSLAKNCGEESAFDLRTLHEQLKKLKEK